MSKFCNCNCNCNLVLVGRDFYNGFCVVYSKCRLVICPLCLVVPYSWKFVEKKESILILLLMLVVANGLVLVWLILVQRNIIFRTVFSLLVQALTKTK